MLQETSGLKGFDVGELELFSEVTEWSVEWTAWGSVVTVETSCIGGLSGMVVSGWGSGSVDVLEGLREGLCIRDGRTVEEDVYVVDKVGGWPVESAPIWVG